MGLEKAAAYLGHSPSMLIEVYRQIEEEDLGRAVGLMVAAEEARKGEGGKVVALGEWAHNGHKEK